MKHWIRDLMLPFLLAGAALAWADLPVVEDVRVTKQGSGGYRFDVTVRHGDTGWDHYADRWQVLDEQGQVLATRVLAHPHVHEQPFTRSLSGIKIPANMNKVWVRAHDNVHGDGKQFEVTIK
jgi:hypothetical protein